jgi:hypothetical protein
LNTRDDVYKAGMRLNHILNACRRFDHAEPDESSACSASLFNGAAHQSLVLRRMIKRSPRFPLT